MESVPHTGNPKLEEYLFRHLSNLEADLRRVSSGSAGPAGPAGSPGVAGPAGPAGLNGTSGTNVVANATITTLWEKSNTGEPVYSTPIYAPDFVSSLYTGPVFIYQSWDWYIYVVKASDGGTVWRYAFGNENYGRAQYVKISGVCYIFGASHDGFVYCLDGDGVVQWTHANLYNREGSGTVTYLGSNEFRDTTKTWATDSFVRNPAQPTINGKFIITVSGIPQEVSIVNCSGDTVEVDFVPAGVSVGPSYSYQIQPRYASDKYYQHAGSLVDEGGTYYLYVCCFDGQVVKLDMSGNLIWKFSTRENIEPYPYVADINGDALNEVVVSSVDGKIYMFTATGTLLGSVEGGEGFDAFVTSANIRGGATNYIISGCRDGHTYLINGSTYSLDAKSAPLDGLAGNDIDSGCALMPNGDGTYRALIANDPGFVACYDKDMNTLWRTFVGSLHNSTPSAHIIGGVYYFIVADMGGGVSFYTNTGTLKTQFYVKGGIEGTMFIQDIDLDGKLEFLITSLDGYVRLIRLESL
jgi:hypothetical protein